MFLCVTVCSHGAPPVAPPFKPAAQPRPWGAARPPCRARPPRGRPHSETAPIPLPRQIKGCGGNLGADIALFFYRAAGGLTCAHSPSIPQACLPSLLHLHIFARCVSAPLSPPLFLLLLLFSFSPRTHTAPDIPGGRHKLFRAQYSSFLSVRRATLATQGSYLAPRILMARSGANNPSPFH